MIGISVVIPVCNSSRASLIACMKSLVSQEYHQSFEVIVVDDGSDNPIVPYIFEDIDIPSNMKLYLIRKRNGGPGSARNEGLYLATGDIIAFIDSDCVARSDWLNTIADFFKRNHDVCGFGGKIESSLEETLTQRFCTITKALSPIFNEDGQLVTAITANACFKRTCLLSVGGFHSAYQRAFEIGLKARGFEDGELSQRLKQRDNSIVYNPEAVVSHCHRKSITARLKQWYGYGLGASVYMQILNCDGREINLEPYAPPKPLSYPNILKGLILQSRVKRNLHKFKDLKCSVVDIIAFTIISELQKATFWLGIKKGREFLNIYKRMSFVNDAYTSSGLLVYEV